MAYDAVGTAHTKREALRQAAELRRTQPISASPSTQYRGVDTGIGDYRVVRIAQ